MKKFDTVKVLGILGTVAGLAATMLTNYTSEKEMKKTVAEEVAKALAEQK